MKQYLMTRLTLIMKILTALGTLNFFIESHKKTPKRKHARSDSCNLMLYCMCFKDY